MSVVGNGSTTCYDCGSTLTGYGEYGRIDNHGSTSGCCRRCSPLEPEAEYVFVPRNCVNGCASVGYSAYDGRCLDCQGARLCQTRDMVPIAPDNGKSDDEKMAEIQRAFRPLKSLGSFMRAREAIDRGDPRALGMRTE